MTDWPFFVSDAYDFDSLLDDALSVPTCAHDVALTDFCEGCVEAIAAIANRRVEGS